MKPRKSMNLSAYMLRVNQARIFLFILPLITKLLIYFKTNICKFFTIKLVNFFPQFSNLVKDCTNYSMKLEQ